MSSSPPSPANAAVLVEGVRKTFGAQTAVDDLHLTVPRGALYGFIGPNGAGKTTTIRMIMSILFPDRGRLAVLGHESALDAKDRIGYLPEERGVYRKMTVGDFVSYVARLKGQRREGLDRRIRKALEEFGLEGAEKKRCEELSKGMLQKVQFITATIHQPDLLILDEPFSGLDPVSMRMLRERVLSEHRRGATVLFSTHVMPQAEEVCEHVVMIHRGCKVLDDSLASIRRRFDSRRIRFEPLEPGASMAPIEALNGVERVDAADGGYEVTVDAAAEPADVIRDIVRALVPARIELARPRLEDIFIDIVTEAGGEEPLDARRDEGRDSSGHRLSLEETA